MAPDDPKRTAFDPDDPNNARGGFSEASIRAQLQRLQSSRSFARAHRLLHLLIYLVEHSLTAGDRDLHEAIIGIEHFKRGSDFDCQTDTIVRVNARRLRDRLAAYYREEGAEDPIRFEIPKGRYRVLFHPGAPQSVPDPVPAADAAALPPTAPVTPAPTVPLSATATVDWPADTGIRPEPAAVTGPPAVADTLAQPRRWRFSPAVAALVVMTALVGLIAGVTRNGEPTAAASVPVRPSTAAPILAVQEQEQLALADFYYGRRASGDVSLALEHYERVLALDKGIADAWVGVAKCIRVLWLEEGLLSSEEALVRQFAALRTALSLDSSHAEAHARMATLQRRWLDDREAASQSMALALQYGGGDPEVLSMVAGYRGLQGDLEGAIDALRAALEREPTNALYRRNLGSYLLLAGRLEEAREQLLHARHLNPGRPRIELDLVEALLGLDRSAEARAVVAAMPPGPEATLAAALLGAAEGQLDEALGALESLAASGIAAQTVLALRGYLFVGDLDRAVACLERSRDLLLAREGPGVPPIFDLYNLYLSPTGRRASGHPAWRRWWQGAGLVAREDGQPSLIDW
ncbi:tetratricopeptide repeat protein [Pseudohaliea rubra]|uniref:Adenylate cyclase n=1 Tax=Pseudohaliea rubra DSM 19751 TaxID=1265313 RepID=A0A095VSW5_9GAMM|nr:tetratricopeptide repeat protein [Pseudohaliea rubra]KGE04455.1 Adenylate cyclase [Pseudohaliea rubra DSM 19751]